MNRIALRSVALRPGGSRIRRSIEALSRVRKGRVRQLEQSSAICRGKGHQRRPIHQVCGNLNPVNDSGNSLPTGVNRPAGIPRERHIQRRNRWHSKAGLSRERRPGKGPIHRLHAPIVGLAGRESVQMRQARGLRVTHCRQTADSIGAGLAGDDLRSSGRSAHPQIVSQPRGRRLRVAPLSRGPRRRGHSRRHHSRPR